LPPSSERRPPALSRLSQLGVLVVAFALPTLIVKAFGTEWGAAATCGQVAFLAAVLAVMLRAG
jgi:hypothetical protein